MIDIIKINKRVLVRLAKLGTEKEGKSSNEQLIFPSKFQADRLKEVIRYSEQELRFLFVEEFKKEYPDLYYSVETPTSGKFKLSKKYETINTEDEGQSASHDMCVFENISGQYKRILNVEFKYKNSGIMNSGKDILKLIREEQNGTFIHLLRNTNKKTLINVFEKLLKCFTDFTPIWVNENKFVEIVIMSLEQQKIIACKLRKQDLINLKTFFALSNGNIDDFDNINWKVVDMKK